MLFLIGLFVCLNSTSLVAQEASTADEAFQQAALQNRPVLMVFSGSDWCLPCIRVKRQVLSTEVFESFAEENLVVLTVDFPQRTSLSEEQEEHNEKLAEEYNPKGEFPHILLIHHDRTVLAQLTWSNQTVQEFISQIESVLPQSTAATTAREFQQQAMLMGCGFEFTIVDEDSAHAAQLLEESINEVKRIESLLSEWIDTTETSRINRAAGQHPVQVSPELYNLLKRSLDISRMTQGAFDISFAGLGTLWTFDGRQTTFPDSSVVDQLRQAIGYQNIQLLDSFRVYLPQKGMKIGFGSIGKGYAADRVRRMLERNGVRGGVINASGDLIAWGTHSDGSDWKVGIADPQDPSHILLWLPIRNRAVATSGNYEKFCVIDGVRYAHIIDPRSGYPVKGVQSVTVVSPVAELSDALATAVFVLGVEVGLDLIDQLPETECIIIDGRNRAHYSKDLKHL